MQKAKDILRGLAAMAGVVLLMAAGGGTGAEIWACAGPGLALMWLAAKEQKRVRRGEQKWIYQD